MKKFIGLILAFALILSVCGVVITVATENENVPAVEVAEYIEGGSMKIKKDLDALCKKNGLKAVCRIEPVKGTTEVEVMVVLQDVSNEDSQKTQKLKDKLILTEKEKDALAGDFGFLKDECSYITSVNINFYTNNILGQKGEILQGNKEKSLIQSIKLEYK